VSSNKLQNRLGQLRKQVDENHSGRVGFFKVFLLSMLAFMLVSSILPTNDYLISPEEVSNNADFTWAKNFNQDIQIKAEWLDSYRLFGDSKGFLSFADTIKEIFVPEATNVEYSFTKEGLESWSHSLSKTIAAGILNFLFLILIGWPIWILGVIAGFVGFHKFVKQGPTDDLLGICCKKDRLFYSGIYGPLVPNNNLSATDISCPSLACPLMAKETLANSHGLTTLLRKYGAYNQTNFDLIRVILAHSDFPGTVEEEVSRDEEGETTEEQTDLNTSIVEKSFVNNSDGTLVKHALVGLASVLEAHQVLVKYYRSSADRKTPKDFDKLRKELTKATETLSPLGKTLALMLTPVRAKAISSLPAKLVASAYLATEAGKSLVFKRLDDQFTKISRFPHLQARAVIQSIPEYHREYNGDARLVIRQAIISSRRHGDFDRAFLPINMPTASRSLREWLEVMYAKPVRRGDTAAITELDAHIEEIKFNWRKALTTSLAEKKNADTANKNENVKKTPENLRFGFAYKSVVLVPLITIVELALDGIEIDKLQHISDLAKTVSGFNRSKIVSSRLPGFQRQIFEVEMISEAVRERLSNYDSATAKKLLNRWTIIRRMLTRYNWLSTRVGDESVPADGLVQAIIRSNENGVESLMGFEALVPLRQRRFKEIFGNSWEPEFFSDSPHPNDIMVYVDQNKYRAALTENTVSNVAIDQALNTAA
jgi:hypothetical protein